MFRQEFFPSKTLPNKINSFGRKIILKPFKIFEAALYLAPPSILYTYMQYFIPPIDRIYQDKIPINCYTAAIVTNKV